MRSEVKLTEDSLSPRLPALYQHKDTGTLAIMHSSSVSTFSGFCVQHSTQAEVGKFIMFDRARCSRVTGSVTLTFDD